MAENTPVWELCREYGLYLPFCPYCDEPTYNEQECCPFCKKPYKWVEGADADKAKDTEVTVGEYTAVQLSNNCIYIYKGDDWVYHAQCTKKMSEEELKEFIERYKERNDK